MFYNHRVWVDDHVYMTQIFKKELNIDIEIVSQICTFPANQSIFLIKNKLRKRLIKSIDTAVTRKEINLRDWTNLKKLLINDREVYNGNTLVTKKDVSNWILYMNSLRDMNFYKIFPNILDDLKDSIL